MNVTQDTSAVFYQDL